ncbi:hypothetical protein HELRODRAFT_180650 [Helobdella robusta]|uniref:Ig-like domain-containing protein n=1 Tax=Helobdella robusta TaxID=6412 RepID=T1FG46_HELRO|nr:hypothetical protein HELRODRAFT_180650 [Helobdella robusta]ESN93782.1 hypothetical protein HELRODRAFT_180650 [Helobdella robusta]
MADVDWSAGRTFLIVYHRHLVLRVLVQRSSSPSYDVIEHNIDKLILRDNNHQMEVTSRPPQLNHRPPHSTPRLTLIENTPILVTCISVGGSPTPTIDIFLKRRNISGNAVLRSVVSQLRGDTKSYRRILREVHQPSSVGEKVMAEDDGSSVTCEGSVTGFKPIRVDAFLEVRYAPKIECQSTERRLGDVNVYIGCLVKAKPHPYEMFWIVDDVGRKVLVNDDATDAAAAAANMWSAANTLNGPSTSVQLYFHHVTASDFRHYRLVVANEVSTSVAEVFLKESWF